MAMLETVVGWLLKAYEASPRLMAVLALLSGALLFLPNRVLGWLALDGLVSTHRPLVSLVFLFSTIMTLSYPVSTVWTLAHRYTLRVRLNYERKKRLEHLDNRERLILGSYLIRNTRTQNFDSNDGTVANLMQLGFLYCPLGDAISDQFPVTIEDLAWDYLHEYPELVGLPPK